MRDYFNPLVLLVVVGMFAWGMLDGEGSGINAGVWAMSLCVSAFLVNGALSLARLITHARRSWGWSGVWHTSS